jgi:hypothetical protein
VVVMQGSQRVFNSHISAVQVLGCLRSMAEVEVLLSVFIVK